MANSNNKLKAYVRFDGTGRVIPGSLILQRFKPKDGKWQETAANLCCAQTTTTTTTAAPTTTTTTTAGGPTTTTTTTSGGGPTTTTTTTSGGGPTTTTTTTTAAPTYTVGQSALGGVIAYILQPGDPGYNASVQHGFVISSQLSANAQWGCAGTDISGTQSAIGTGAANTAAIVAGCATAGIAARLCDDYSNGGYSDWYLPSADELYAIRNNIFVAGMPALYNANVWSSTQAGNAAATSVVYSFSPFTSTVPKDNTSTPYQEVYAFRSF